jgi:transglutaminase-like putative cysteine protease
MTGHRHRGVVAAAATLLAALPLAAIFEEWGWFLRCVVVVAAVYGAATGVRALRAPLWGQILAMSAALVAAVTWQFPSGQEFVTFVPTAATFEHLGVVLGRLPADVRDYSIPVPAVDSLVLVTMIGVGIVAILVDVLAVGIHRPALAGLPMLAIYSVPVAVLFGSVPLPLFALGAFGYLWLLGTDNMDRVRRFGRRFTGDGRDMAAWEPSPLAATGRRLAVIGVLVALALPLAVPGMTTGLVDRFGPGLGSGPGPGGTRQINLFAELYGQLNQEETVELVRVTTNDPNPFYLRLATADQVTPSGFHPSAPSGSQVTQVLTRVDTPLPPTTRRYQAMVEISDEFAMQLAPTYSDLNWISGLDSRWLYDAGQQIVYSNRASTSGARYELGYVRPQYDPEALRQVRPLPANHPIQQQYAQIPQVQQVQALLQDVVTADAAPYDQVRQIRAFFSRSNGFRYNLETGPETDAPAIVDFLENRVGFCVQYASAMTWLVRSVGVPARVAFGFTRGSGSDELRVLTNRNLHAWTEVYFTGHGWVPFDPTPGAQVPGSVSPEWAPDPDAPVGSDTNVPQPGGDPSDPDNPDGGPLPEDDPGFGDDLEGGGAPLAPPSRPWWALAVAGMVVALLALPGTQRATLRRRRMRWRGTPAGASGGPGGVVSGDATATARHQAHDAWDELIDTMLDYRLSLDLTESPRATGDRLATRLGSRGEAYRAAKLLGQAEERARYSRTPLESEELATAVQAVRHALVAHTRSGARLRATLMPPSTLLRWRVAGSDALTRVLRTANRLGDLTTRLSPRRLIRAAR